MKICPKILFTTILFASVASATEYNFVAKAWYSFEDPNAWSPTGGKSGSYAWTNDGDNTFIFDSSVNTTAENGVAVKYFSDTDQLDVKSIIFKTKTSLKGNNNSKTYFPTITVENLTAYAAADATTTHALNSFRQVNNTYTNIGTNLASPAAKETILSMTFRNDDAYYYNSATDNFAAANLGRVTLNGAVIASPTSQNSAFIYLNNQSASTTTPTSVVVTMNGLSGSGIIRNNFADNAEGTSTLVFKNTADATFNGIIMDDWDATAKKSKILVIMDGAANATQTIRQSSFWERSVWNRNDVDSVGTTIKNGTLAISSLVNGANKSEIARVRLEGGALAVASQTEGGTLGKLYVRGIDWVDGKIKVVINRSDLQINKGIAQLGDENAKYIFEVDLSDFTSDANFEGDEFTLISSTSNTFGDIEKYGAEFIYNGSKISGLDYDILSTANGLSIALTGTIPEPSQVAVAIALCALALVAARKRFR